LATPFVRETARLALPHLVRAAQRRVTLTYEDLGSRIGRHHRTLNRPLGHIAHDFCRSRNLPLLTAVVVRKDTGLPGDAFLPDGRGNMSDEEYSRRVEKHLDEVFACRGWDELLKDLGLRPIPKTPEDLDEEGRKYSRFLEGRKGGEWEAHRMLKDYVAENPEAIGLTGATRGTRESLFVSGDRCDVIFDLEGEGSAVVEVKNGGHHGELAKGVYQAVKYRALTVAEKGHGESYPVAAYLVAHDITADVVELAARFGIECRTVDRALVERSSGSSGRHRAGTN
jgi:hypothetical protein